MGSDGPEFSNPPGLKALLRRCWLFSGNDVLIYHTSLCGTTLHHRFQSYDVMRWWNGYMVLHLLAVCEHMLRQWYTSAATMLILRADHKRRVLRA
jgi:hypothetical protein|mmetsp:Transcript_27239/g.46245  ORF Transcript_27239/g.46245 Transcript_27239/m.46245 type:complete len:95 (+) Transcript_27239:247-531(+)